MNALTVAFFAAGIAVGAAMPCKAHGPEFPHNDPDPDCWILKRDNIAVPPPNDYTCVFVPQGTQPHEIHIIRNGQAWGYEDWDDQGHYFAPPPPQCDESIGDDCSCELTGDWDAPDCDKYDYCLVIDPSEWEANGLDCGNDSADMTLGGFRRPEFGPRP